MKVIILAAGEGVRMHPLTLDKPKPMISISGKPHLERIFGALTKYVSESDIAVVVEYKKEQIIDYFKDSKITFIEQDPEKRGTGGAIMVCKEFTGEDDFLVIHADMLFSEETYKSFVNLQDKFSYIGSAEVPIEQASKYGVLKIEEDFVIDTIEKPENPPSNLIITGIYKYTKEFYNLIQNAEPVLNSSGKKEYLQNDVFAPLSAKKLLKWKKSEITYDLTVPEDVENAEKSIS